MGLNLEQFAAQCREALQQGSEMPALENVRKHLEKALVDPDFVAAHLGPDNNADRTVIYEDPELGFAICAHVHNNTYEGTPHDHGDAWAIYGQAVGTTEMTEWRKLAEATGDAPGKVEFDKTYALDPGMAAAYPVGAIHSPAWRGETRLIRIEQHNLDHGERRVYTAD